MALGPRAPLSRQSAWGCLTSNLAVPGTGSLIAGRRSGFIQLIVAAAGLLISLIFGIRFIWWMLANWTRFHGPELDPASALAEMWIRLRWALAGMGLFGVSWLWALGSSLGILHSVRAKNQPPPLPGPGR